MDAPRVGIDFEHLCVAEVGYQQVRSPAVVEDVNVIRRDAGRLVEGFCCLFRLFLRQANDAKPHPGLRIFRIGGDFFLNRSGGRLQLAEMKMGDSEEKVGAMKAGFQAKRFL